MSGIECCASFQDRDRFVSLCLRLFSWRQYVAQQGGFVCNTMVLGLSFVAIASHAQAPVPDSPAIEQRVDAMLKKLTLEQKLELICLRRRLLR